MKVTHITILLTLLLTLTACTSEADTQPTAEPPAANDSAPQWTTAELATIRSLWLGSLPDLPLDPTNAVADDLGAANLGHHLFFDTRFSSNGEVSCATCHLPGLLFTDGRPLSEAIGTTLRGAPTIVGVAYSPWFFWDGRRDSQWSQAITPMEDPNEHGGTRTQYAHLIDEDLDYRIAYEALFGPLPDLSGGSRFPDSASPLGDQDAIAAWESMTPGDQETVNRIFANIGKAIAAYERLIMPGPARFDQYAEAIVNERLPADILTADEAAGLKLFIGPAHCIQCHNGPLFTNHHFHNINLPPVENLPLDYGRINGLREVLNNDFNCVGSYSDSGGIDACPELKYVKTKGDELPGAFKVPTLRNIAQTAPYMHTGQFTTLNRVVSHYNAAKDEALGHNELVPLAFTETQLNQIVAFLQTLSGPLDVEEKWLLPPE